jgi:hypothetical protein
MSGCILGAALAGRTTAPHAPTRGVGDRSVGLEARDPARRWLNPSRVRRHRPHPQEPTMQQYSLFTHGNALRVQDPAVGLESHAAREGMA